jgi:hypothetical protein
MKKFTIILATLIACNSTTTNETYVQPEDALDAGSRFITACNKGNFVIAKQYVFNSSLNMAVIDSIEQAYRSLDRDAREQLRNASINIANIKIDSTSKATLIRYSNSYKKQVNILPITNKNDIWQVDFAIR